MSIAAKYRPYYTYDDYCQWKGRWELIEGMPYAMSPGPGPVHQRALTLLSVEFLRAFGKYKTCKVYPSIDWKITEDTVVGPDLIVCDNIAPEKAFLDFTPALIAEIISPATASKDRGRENGAVSAAAGKILPHR